MAVEEERAATSREFSAYGPTLDMVPSFKYMERLLLVEDDDCPAMIQNLTKARAVWRIVTRVLTREGVRPQVFIFFFKSFFQSVFLFVAETWVPLPPPLDGSWDIYNTRWCGD